MLFIYRISYTFYQIIFTKDLLYKYCIYRVAELCDTSLCVFVCVCADEQMYRCEDCDELFSSTLELRRHQKYSCSSTGSIFDTLREDFKQEREDSDEPIHECKDCEKIFPNEYRYNTLVLIKMYTFNTYSALILWVTNVTCMTDWTH